MSDTRNGRPVLSTGYAGYPVESGRAPYWSLVARLAVIPWSLVAHTNSRLKKPSNSLRDQTPNCARQSDTP
jgi:hypothetical protein